MASTQAIGPAVTAILAILRTVTALTTYVGTRIYPDPSGCDVPGKATYPYVSVEVGNELPENTMGGTPDVSKWGSDVQVHIRIASNTRSDTQAWTIHGLVKGALDGQPISVTGYPSASIAYEDLQPLRSDVAGAVVREWVTRYSVLVHQ